MTWSYLVKVTWAVEQDVDRNRWRCVRAADVTWRALTMCLQLLTGRCLAKQSPETWQKRQQSSGGRCPFRVPSTHSEISSLCCGPAGTNPLSRLAFKAPLWLLVTKVCLECAPSCQPVGENASPTRHRRLLVSDWLLVVPGEGLRCYECKVGLWNLCFTTEKTCRATEQCYSLYATAGNEKAACGRWNAPACLSGALTLCLRLCSQLCPLQDERLYRDRRVQQDPEHYFPSQLQQHAVDHEQPVLHQRPVQLWAGSARRRRPGASRRRRRRAARRQGRGVKEAEGKAQAHTHPDTHTHTHPAST